MRATINIDERLLSEAGAYTGLSDISAVIHEALTALVEREAARRLAALGGSQPDAKPIPRRRPPDFRN